MKFLKRPFLNEFLELVSKFYEVLVYFIRYILQVLMLMHRELLKKLIQIVNIFQEYYLALNAF